MEMLRTARTDNAYWLLRSYAKTSSQKQAVDRTYIDTLLDPDNEDQVVIRMLGLILDGLRDGNWLWNTPVAQKEF
jgi:hypothetical protein